jgi:hypothetical protein
VHVFLFDFFFVRLVLIYSLLALCEGPALSLFRPWELQLLICGSPHLDFRALEKAARYQDGFEEKSPIITQLWEIVHEVRLATFHLILSSSFCQSDELTVLFPLHTSPNSCLLLPSSFLLPPSSSVAVLYKYGLSYTLIVLYPPINLFL